MDYDDKYILAINTEVSLQDVANIFGVSIKDVLENKLGILVLEEGHGAVTRLERIISAFNDYDEIVENLIWDHNDGTYERELKRLRKEVNELVTELKQHGCRREN